MKIEQNKNPRENLEEKMNKIKTRAKRGKIFGQNKNPRAKRARKFWGFGDPKMGFLRGKQQIWVLQKCDPTLGWVGQNLNLIKTHRHFAQDF